MKPLSFSILPCVFVLLFSYHCRVTSANTHVTSADARPKNFLQCLSLYSENSTSISKVSYTQNSSSYSSILDFSIQNFRFSTSNTPKPQFIVTPSDVSHVQAAIKCSQKYGLEIRVRSGGHDFEGLSYVSRVPFIIIDLTNLSSINVDVDDKIAWVQAGVTIGQLYYRIAEKSKTLAFPAGTCPTVGVGGHFSGGGYGFMLRKFGLAADYIVDAHLIDAKGRLLDRESMGEDLFWAIRGSGGASFGVIVSWKVKLVTIPSIVTIFRLVRTLEQNATKIVHKWQHVANKLPEDLYIDVVFRSVNSSTRGKRTTVSAFESLFLGGVDRLLPLMQESFPELGLKKEDCKEMSWIESALYHAGLQNGESIDVLLSRNSTRKGFFKAKSDYVKEPMPEKALEGIYDMFSKEEGHRAFMALIPYGGKMSEFSESEIPFPHRAGNLYKILYVVGWRDNEARRRYINWIRKFYSRMAPYVSRNPREAYLNYRDLDIGSNNYKGYTSYKQASIWGKKYFKNNFNRLVQVKTKVDPGNFFKNEQSIPPLSSRWIKKDG